MKLIVKKQASSLHPSDQASWDVFDKLPVGKELVCEIKTRGRTAEFLSRYWSILTVAVDHSEAWDDRDDVDHWVRMQIPWMREEYMVEEDGTVIVRLKSISIEEMDTETFDKFYERAMQLISAKIGTDIETIAAEVWARKKRRHEG